MTTTEDLCGCPEIDSSRVIRAAVLTLSDTRKLDNDKSGNAVVAHLTGANHECVVRDILSDDAEPLRHRLNELVKDSRVEVILTTGGTGIAPRDLAIDVIDSMLDVSLPGFGETFRRISVDEIGAKAMLSRAVAGRIGNTPIFAMPGSTGAVHTAMTQCVLPVLVHTVMLSQG
ncbi:MAG: MogA/MoaB family molybdenum cofactor biosynthesis protein [Planctomycetota bacterium]